MAETELERAEKKYAQAKARLQALKNRAATQARKLRLTSAPACPSRAPGSWPMRSAPSPRASARSA